MEAAGGKLVQVAWEMRLHDSSVENSVRHASETKGDTALTAEERAEIRALRAELERVTLKRDILGKPSAAARRRTGRTCDRGVHVHR